MRQVITKRTFGVAREVRGANPAHAPVPDGYLDRLIKYIPVETIILWIGIFGSTSALAYGSEFFPLFARWALILGTAGTYLYFRYIAEVHDYVQLCLATTGFIVWVHAFAVLPFTALPSYSPVVGALLLPLYTALVPMVDGISRGSPAAPAW